MKEHLLEIKDLSVCFHTMDADVHAVNGIDLAIDAGETLGLVGETGAGKTTTALAILNLIQSPPGKIESGQILFAGRNILEMTDDELLSIRGSAISMIFQDPMTALNPIFRVEDQIAEVIRIHEKKSKREAVEKAREMLELVGIPAERGSDYPHQFSGGIWGWWRRPATRWPSCTPARSWSTAVWKIFSSTRPIPTQKGCSALCPPWKTTYTGSSLSRA